MTISDRENAVQGPERLSWNYCWTIEARETPLCRTLDIKASPDV